MHYPEDFENKIICGDCMEIMKDIPDNSIDMILCDLPYGITACKWDTVIPLDKLWEQYKRIIKDNSAMVFTATQPFTSKLVMSNLEMFKYEWVWDKHISRGMHIAKYRPMQKHENILIFGKGKLNYYPIMIKREKPVKVKNYGSSKSSPLAHNDREFRIYTHKNPESILVGYWEKNKGKLHPTQKPVSLFEYLIKTYANEGDQVLDNCIGSGTTAIACLKLSRKFIGIDISPKYCEIAEKRLMNEKYLWD